MTTQIRSQFLELFTESKIPQLEDIVRAKREMFPSMIPILFNVDQMSTDIYQTYTMSGLRHPTLKLENQNVQFQTSRSGYTKTFTSSTYANAYRISREMVRDGKVNMIANATDSFGIGMAEVWEYKAASVFDEAFTVNGYDGVPLCSTAHPLENGDGVTVANRPVDPSELSVTSYRELRNIMQDTLNEDGQRVQYRHEYLVVSQGNQDVAKEIMKSAYDPTSGNNTINTVFETAKLVPGDYWAYLSSDTAWYLVGPKSEHGLMFLNRDPFETDSDYDKHAFAYEVIASERRAWGSKAWRGFAGNPGA